jgi:HrpA-like RNA helicase
MHLVLIRNRYQRAGRAGRLRNGKCFRLYSEASLSQFMDESTTPEILRSNLTSFLLTLKALGVQNILAFDLMNRPSVDSLCHGLETLYALGAIDNETNLTKLGYQMADFPASPFEAKMMLESMNLGCAREIACVAAALQVKSLFYQPKTQRQRKEYDEAMNEIVDVSGDHVTYVNLMETNDSTPFREDECRMRFINYHALRRVSDVRSQLISHLKRYGRIDGIDDGTSTSERSAYIRRCVTAGFFTNVAKLGNDGQYYSIRGKSRINVSTFSTFQRFGAASEYILYGETYDGSQGGIEARHCSSIEAKWLRDVAPDYWG